MEGNMVENLESNIYEDVISDIGKGVINICRKDLTGRDILIILVALERKIADIKREALFSLEMNLEEKDIDLMKYFINLFKNDTNVFSDRLSCISAIKLTEPDFINDLYIADVVKMLEDKSIDIYSNNLVNKFIREMYSRSVPDKDIVFGIPIIDYVMDHEILYSYMEIVDKLKEILNKMI